MIIRRAGGTKHGKLSTHESTTIDQQFLHKRKKCRHRKKPEKKEKLSDKHSIKMATIML